MEEYAELQLPTGKRVEQLITADYMLQYGTNGSAVDLAGRIAGAKFVLKRLIDNKE
jgi:hypothetical protein